MAFDGNNPHIKSVLSDLQEKPVNKVVENPEQPTTKEAFLSSIVPDNERKKTYTFTMRPSVRERLDQKVKEKGFRSASELLEVLINNL